MVQERNIITFENNFALIIKYIELKTLFCEKTFDSKLKSF